MSNFLKQRRCRSQEQNPSIFARVAKFCNPCKNENFRNGQEISQHPAIAKFHNHIVPLLPFFSFYFYFIYYIYIKKTFLFFIYIYIENNIFQKIIIRAVANFRNLRFFFATPSIFVARFCFNHNFFIRTPF